MLSPAFADQANQTSFAVDHRLRLADALAPDQAERVARALEASTDFDWVMTENGVPRTMSNDAIQQLGAQGQQALQNGLYGQAQRGVGFLYKGRHLDKSDDAVLGGFLGQLNDEKSLAAFRSLTGDDRIASAEAQATRYEPGHFLTRHLDDPVNEKRLYAYIFSFCRNWHPDWGGLLQFFEKDGTPRDAWAPGFNTLSLFSVRHIHSVTYIAPYAGQARLSITGWLHGG